MVSYLFLLIGIFFLGINVVSSSTVTLNNTKLKIHMYDTVPVQFSFNLHASSTSRIEILASSSDLNVANVNVPIYNHIKLQNETWNDTINVTGNFLGTAKINFSISVDRVRIIYITFYFDFIKSIVCFISWKFIFNLCIYYTELLEQVLLLQPINIF